MALSELSLVVPRAEFLGVQGPSGCGKSTLLNILGLCDSPDSGELAIAGERIEFRDEARLATLRRRVIGYVFQYFNLLPTLSAHENVQLAGLLAGKDLETSSAESAALLGELGLGERLDHFPHQLSGGQMQRVAIARALVHRPVVILADEPTGNLDSRSGGEVIELLAASRDRGAAIVMASHSEQALSRCDKVISLRDGHLQ